MRRKFATEQAGDYWFVIDTTLPDDCDLVYEDLTPFEAKTIVEILNNSEEDMTFDQVCADWRWAVLEQIEELAIRCQSLS